MKREHPLNAAQFKLFYRPHELMALDSVDVGDSDTYDHEIGWRHKADEAKMSGLADSVDQSGISTPVVVQTSHSLKWDAMGNGHHRVASAAMKEQTTGRPQYVPAIHDTDYMGDTTAIKKAFPAVYRASSG